MEEKLKKSKIFKLIKWFFYSVLISFGLFILLIIILAIIGVKPSTQNQIAKEQIEDTLKEKSVSENKIAQKQIEEPAQEIKILKKQISATSKEMMNILNEVNSNAGSKIFKRLSITREGRRCEITISDIWYSLPQQNKERTIEALANNYAHISAKHGLRGAKPNEANYPTTSLVDEYGKEVAYRSTLRMKIMK